MKEILEKIENGQSNLIGEGPWVKDSAYQVHEVDGKYYTIVVYDSMSYYLMDETLEEIKKEEIEEYI